MIDCLIALGGNVGAVGETFQRAAALLNAAPETAVGRMSGLYLTKPVGARAGNRFINAALRLQTSLAPLDLLDLLLAVEARLGRTREIHWGPRTLDLDLLFYGSEILDLPLLQVPHPACWYRRFVLDPLVEIAAEFVHPVKAVTVAALHSRLKARPLSLALAGGTAAQRTAISQALRPEFGEVEVSEWRSSSAASAEAPTLIAWLGTAAGGERTAEPGERTPIAEPFTNSISFAALPVVPRLDASQAPDAAAFLRDVLHSAMD